MNFNGFPHCSAKQPKWHGIISFGLIPRHSSADSAPDAFGVVIEIDGKLAYIAGDTCLRPDKVDEIKCGLDFDIMIAPTNGTFGNMNEAESAELCRGIKPKLMIPCHFGCFAEQWGNPLKFIEVMEAELPDQKYNLMRIGEQIEI